jgi:hypothetical protein
MRGLHPHLQAAVDAAGGKCQCSRPSCRASHVDPEMCGQSWALTVVSANPDVSIVQACDAKTEVTVLCGDCAALLARATARALAKISEQQGRLW